MRLRQPLLLIVTEGDGCIIHLQRIQDPLAAVRTAREAAAPPRIVAYLSHVQTELAAAAREAGAEEVMPRSEFTANLPEILTSRVAIQHIDRVMALSVRPVRLTRTQALVKRSFDLVLATSALVVLFPVIDACLDLRSRLPNGEQIAQVMVRGHPLMRERADRPAVETGREAKVSIQHSVAVAFLDGAAGLVQYADRRVADPAVRALRAKVAVEEDAGVPVESAVVILRPLLIASRGGAGDFAVALLSS